MRSPDICCRGIPFNPLKGWESQDIDIVKCGGTLLALATINVTEFGLAGVPSELKSPYILYDEWSSGQVAPAQNFPRMSGTSPVAVWLYHFSEFKSYIQMSFKCVSTALCCEIHKDLRSCLPLQLNRLGIGRRRQNKSRVHYPRLARIPWLPRPSPDHLVLNYC